jgi:short subunit dehydrogenase-like uncharacterized protein
VTRDFDVILYGATGFTGRQTVAYFAQHAPSTLRWAIAGRNRTKLESLLESLNAAVPVLAADSNDQPAIDAMVSRTRVLATTAGPFALYGTGIVDACVRLGAHYADITGETSWVRMLIDRYHEKAAAEGTRIIPFCGFDSIPSDLGAMLLAQALGPETREIKAFFKIKGGINGGTLASMQNTYESSADTAMADPFLLSPSIVRAPRDLELDPSKESYDTDVKSWVAPFIMGKINTRVVRRSSAILGLDFAYQEYMKFSGAFAGPLALAAAAGGSLFDHAMHSQSMRRLLRTVSPAPGEGPSEHTMDNGWFRCELFGKAANGRTAEVVVSDQGDPGNRVTVKCLCESALALALDQLPDRAGVLTPATGIGEALVTRLRARGMTLTADCYYRTSSPVAAIPGVRNVFGNSPSPAKVNLPNRLNHCPAGTSGSDSNQCFNSAKSSIEIRPSRKRAIK